MDRPPWLTARITDHQMGESWPLLVFLPYKASEYEWRIALACSRFFSTSRPRELIGNDLNNVCDCAAVFIKTVNAALGDHLVGRDGHVLDPFVWLREARHALEPNFAHIQLRGLSATDDDSS